MAHGIAHVLEDGELLAQAAFWQKPAWHNLGDVIVSDRPPNSEEMIRRSRLDVPVTKEPMLLKSDLREVGSQFWATVREDNRSVLGIVGPDYQVTQNVDCFKFLDSLAAEGKIGYESAFGLHGMKQIVVLARMPSIDEIAEGDDCLRYILCSNSHDGTSNLTLTPTSVRVVCANTLRIALANKKYQIRLRHSGDMAEKMKAAAEALSQFDKQFTLFADDARTLAEKQISADAAGAFINELFPEPTAKDGQLPSRTVIKNWKAKVDAITRNFTADEKNTMPSIKGTWWAMVNALTQFVDHEGNYRGDNDKKQLARYDDITDGKGADLKNYAFNLALTMAS